MIMIMIMMIKVMKMEKHGLCELIHRAPGRFLVVVVVMVLLVKDLPTIIMCMVDEVSDENVHPNCVSKCVS